jgi:hypothetical protein
MSLGDVLGDIWGSVEQEVERRGGWGDVALEGGMAIYNYMNRGDESHRSMPPTPPTVGIPGAGGPGAPWGAGYGPATWVGGGGTPALTPIGQQITDLVTDPVGTITQWFGDEPGGMSMANGAVIPHAQHPPLFRARNASAVGQRVIPVMNPVTGKTHFFGDLGTPLLFSRDFSAHKRVNRLARKAARGRTRSRKRR